MGYVNVSEAASQMGVSVRRVQQMCKSGEISGAIKKGRSWMIPADEENDVQGTKNPSLKKRLPLPIGISDYKLATTEYYYVDKTLLIRDFLGQQTYGFAVYPATTFWKNAEYGHASRFL